MARKQENTGFVCVACGRDVPPIRRGTIRDHCRFCLCSVHVDETPGDRDCECHGILRPIGTDYRGNKGHILIYRCERCGAVKRNRAAPDDDLDRILQVQAEQAARLLP